MENEKVAYLENPPARKDVDTSEMIATIHAWKDILNARLLAVIALFGALGVFVFTLYDPSALRLWAAALYSIGVLWPVMALFFRKG